jgi:hypothetical protein
MKQALLKRSNWFILGFITLITKGIVLGSNWPDAIVLLGIFALEFGSRWLDLQDPKYAPEKDLQELSDRMSSLETKFGMTMTRRRK